MFVLSDNSVNVSFLKFENQSKIGRLAAKMAFANIFT